MLDALSGINNEMNKNCLQLSKPDFKEHQKCGIKTMAD